MKHSWAPAAFNPQGSKSLYIEKSICRHCGLERYAWLNGRWKNFRFYHGDTPYPSRPDCVQKIVTIQAINM